MTEVFSRPEYGNWLNRRSPLAWLYEQFQKFAAWLDRLNLTHPLVYQFIFWGCVVLLVILVVHMAYTTWIIYQRTAHPRADPQAVPRASAPSLSPASRAESLARAGRFTEALAWRYLALVHELEERKAVEARVSKTPAEYVVEARLDPDGRATLAGLVGSLYRHVFGAEPCDAAGYAEFSAAARAVVGHVTQI